MAEDAGPKTSGTLGGVILAIFIIVAISGYFDRGQDLKKEQEVYKPKTNEVIGINKVFKPGDLERGVIVINERPIVVRKDVGGVIIGEQKERTEGQVLEGPVKGYGGNWWKIDYEEAPDGWVLESDITSHTGFFKLINIFPILYDLFLPVGIVFSVIAIILIIMIRIKFDKVLVLERKKRRMLDEDYEPAEEFAPAVKGVPNLPIGDGPPKTVSRNSKWDHVQNLIKSNSINDWRQAIIEADIILDEMLQRMGYEGESVGEKLKGIDRSDFVTLDNAWEAHKVRNRIAHDGSEFKITRHDVEKTIEQYEKVFKEFYYI